MMPTISSIRALIVGAARPIHFSGQYHSGKRGLSFSPRLNAGPDSEMESEEAVSYTQLAVKVDDGFKKINERLDKVDSRVDSWIKWGVRIGFGLVATAVGAMFESRNHMNKKMDHMDKKMDQKIDQLRDLISKSIKESEERLESKITLSLEKGIREEVRGEVMYALGLVNVSKIREAEK